MILCVGGKAHGKRVEYIGQCPTIDGDKYVLHKYRDSYSGDKIEHYLHEGSITHVPLRFSRIL